MATLSTTMSSRPVLPLSAPYSVDTSSSSSFFCMFLISVTISLHFSSIDVRSRISSVSFTSSPWELDGEYSICELIIFSRSCAGVVEPLATLSTTMSSRPVLPLSAPYSVDTSSSSSFFCMFLISVTISLHFSSIDVRSRISSVSFTSSPWELDGEYSICELIIFSRSCAGVVEPLATLSTTMSSRPVLPLSTPHSVDTSSSSSFSCDGSYWNLSSKISSQMYS